MSTSSDLKQTYLQSELSVTAPKLKSYSLVSMRMTCKHNKVILLDVLKILLHKHLNYLLYLSTNDVE